jgi:small-conductance mechanosensitive channel
MVPALALPRNRSSITGRLFLAGFLLCLVVLPLRGFGQGEEIPNLRAQPSDTTDVDVLIKVLEDPSARQRLIGQLKTLSEAHPQGAKESKSKEQPAVRAAGAEILQSLSEHMISLGERTLLPLARLANQLPVAFHWMYQQLIDSNTRPRWTQMLTSLAAIMGIGYGAFVVVQLLLIRSRRKLVSRRPQQSRLVRLSTLTVLLLFDLLATALFAATAYLALSLVEPTAQVRVVALAWIAAATVVRALMAATRFFLAPDTAELRLWPMSGETIHYASIWARRLSITPVYGYVTLEAAVVLGLPQNLFDPLLALLGLLVSALILILIWQNRGTVANFIRRTTQRPKETALRALREQLAAWWHLLASTYVLLLYGVWVLQIPGGFQSILQASALTLLVIALGNIALRLLASMYQRGIRLSTDLRARFPGIEGRINRYFPRLYVGARGIIYAITALGILEAWGVDSSWLLTSEPARILAGTLGTLLLIVVFAIALWELTSSVIDRQLRETDAERRRQAPSARVKTLLAVGRNAAFSAITVVTLLLVLSELGIDIAPLLAGAGVVGLAVGFGAQTLVKDIITGAIILFQDLVAVGEVVKVGDTAGLVEAISIRHIRLRDLSGTVHTIPFSAISTISNLTKDFSFYVFDIGVAYREDVDRVMDVLKDLGTELQQDPELGSLILAPLEIFGLDRFADSAIVIKARIKTLPIQQWTIGREFNRRLKRRFDELGIEIPFPHRTLYFGIDKQGEAPPARVQLAGGISVPSSPPELLHAGEHAKARQQEISQLSDRNE